MAFALHLELSLLLVSCFTAFGEFSYSLAWPLGYAVPPAPSPHAHHSTYAPFPQPAQHHHHHSQTKAPAPAPAPHKYLPPAKPPVPMPHPPAKPPVPMPHPPVKPPSHQPHPLPARRFVAVRGVVFLKPCKYAGVDTLLGAVPVPNATVELQCNNSMKPIVKAAKTDKNGYFYLEAPKTVTSFAFHKCRVKLVSSPQGNKPSNLHDGAVGASLRPIKMFVSNKRPFVLFDVGPFAFEPKGCY